MRSSPRWAGTSEAAYRELVADDAFVRFFETVTPLAEVSRLQLGSRPAKRLERGGHRRPARDPWVFSWTQARIVLPGWFGLGTALEAAEAAHGLELLHARCAATGRSSAPWSPTPRWRARRRTCRSPSATRRCRTTKAKLAGAVDARIRDELRRTTDALVRLGDGERLLDAEPTLRDSIDRRNPYVDPLSYVQVELLRRLRAAGDRPDDTLAQASLLTINGIASGLRNTG